MATTQTGNAITFADYAKNSDSPTAMDIVASLYEFDSVLLDFPFVSKDYFVARGQRIDPGGLPAVGYGRINETPDLIKTTADTHEESAWLIRENVRLDDRMRNRKDLITNPLKIQAMGLIEAWCRQLNYDFITNDPSTGTKEGPVGLKTRLLNITKYGQVADLFIDAGGLTTGSGATEANANTFFSLLDTMLDRLNASDGTGVVLYMNDDMRRAFPRLARLLKTGLKYSMDNFDRSIPMYKNAKIKFIGRQIDDTTNIITNTENSTGTLDTGSVYSSIYGVHYGENYVRAWHDGILDLKAVGLDPTGTQFYYLVDYLCGLWHGHSRGIGRIYHYGSPAA